MAKKRTAAKRAALKKPATSSAPTTPKGEPLPRAMLALVVHFERASTSDMSDGEIRSLMDALVQQANERGVVQTAVAEWAPTDVRTEVLV